MALSALVLGAPSLAHAHIRLDIPEARTTPNLKTGPCGASTAGTPQVIEGWTAGATVTIEYTETIDHPSHYRVALSREGESAFVDPADADDKATDGNELRDDIEDLDEGNNRKGSFEVVLPDEPCENCVLQLMQIMYDKPSMPFYYQCADVAIGPGEANGGSGGGGNLGTGGDNGVGGQDGGGGAVGGGGTDASGGAFAASGGSSGMSGSTGGVGAGSGGEMSGAGGLASAGGSLAGVGGDDFGDDSQSAAPSGGCSLGKRRGEMSTLGLLGLFAFVAFGRRRARTRS